MSSLFLLLHAASFAHLPAYEGERVRNGNHFTDNGFAEPVRGECDITANGPTDDKAGSANIYLGGDNVPPNFFCGFTTQDDWSFERPVDIIESSRTPAPDPTDLNLPLEEGYIPCSPNNRDPFQCPRQIRNPVDGKVIALPGQCIDVGQPDDPAAANGPDGNYHCALLPGAPRPRTSSVLFSTLTGYDDVDWAVYRYQPVYGLQPIVGAAQVPACEENLALFVTHAYAGPLGMKDARSGKPLFMPVIEAGWLPTEIRDQLPDGYGVRVTRPRSFTPTPGNRRVGYASGFAQNGWLLAPDSVIECIDNFEKCLADEKLAKHYQSNDIFFIKEDQPVDLYLMWWVDSPHFLMARRKEWDYDINSSRFDHSHYPRGKLTDVSITTGVIDQFIVGDFINISMTGPFSGNGRYLHGKCTDPRPFGSVDIEIENNQF